MQSNSYSYFKGMKLMIELNLAKYLNTIPYGIQFYKVMCNPLKSMLLDQA